MPLFNVVGIDKETGRAVRKVYRGVDEAEIKERALRHDGLRAKWIEQRLCPPATAAQKKRLAELGCRCIDALNVQEAGDRLRSLLQRDQPASQELLAAARQLNVEATEYVGVKHLFDRMFRELTQPGNEQQLARWFVYRVYLTLVGDEGAAMIKGPNHAVIQRIASYLSGKAEVVASIKKYGAGREWIRFGHYLDAEGRVQRGGRMETVAFQQAKACFEHVFEKLPQLRPRASRGRGAASDTAVSLPDLV